LLFRSSFLRSNMPKRTADMADSLPLCPEGKDCSRFTNAVHWADFSHPREPCPDAVCDAQHDLEHIARYSHPDKETIAKKARVAVENKDKAEDDDDEEGEEGEAEEEVEEEEQEEQREDEEEEQRRVSKFGAAVNPVQARAASERRELLKPLLRSVLHDFPPGLAEMVADYDGPADLRSSWLPRVKPAHDIPISDTKFGGVPFLKSDEKWPACSACKKNLTFFFQLRGSDVPIELVNQHVKEQELLQMFVCTDTDGNCDTYESFAGSHCIRLVDPSAVRAADVATIRLAAGQARDSWLERKLLGWKRTVDIPHCDDYELYGLPATNDDEDEQFDDDDEASSYSGEKLSGFPAWVQGNEQPECPQCNTTMDFVFQVPSEGLFDYLFGDCGIGHITQCPNHKEVLAFRWAC